MLAYTDSGIPKFCLWPTKALQMTTCIHVILRVPPSQVKIKNVIVPNPANGQFLYSHLDCNVSTGLVVFWVLSAIVFSTCAKKEDDLYIGNLQGMPSCWHWGKTNEFTMLIRLLLLLLFFPFQYSTILVPRFPGVALWASQYHPCVGNYTDYSN